jgi:cytochrome c
MKRNVIATIILIVLGLTFSLAFAMGHEAAARGKVLFEDPGFAGGKRACSSCHPGGDGLLAAGTRTQFTIMDKSQTSLEEAINFCIVNANRGKEIPLDSEEMQDMVSYIKSLESK